MRDFLFWAKQARIQALTNRLIEMENLRLAQAEGKHYQKKVREIIAELKGLQSGKKQEDIVNDNWNRVQKG